jgi:hypothetical protein
VTGPTGERVTVEVRSCGACERCAPCRDDCTQWPHEPATVAATLTGRDALVMDWARKQLAHRAYVDSLMVGRITQEQWVENRRLVAIVTEAFTALAAFDARPAEGDENA